jgi:putative endopeptidase
MKPLSDSLALLFKSAAVCSLGLALLPASAQEATTPVHGINVANMDKSVKPGDNWYLYCNGDWIKNTTMPADRARLSVFSALDDIANKNTAAIIEEIAKGNPPAGSGQRKIADLYNSYMDEKAIDAKGIEPLQPHLKAIAKISNQKELAYALGQSLRADTDALNNTNFHTIHLFGLWVAPGFEDPEHYTPYLMQGGIALPDRDYYLSESEHMKQVRAKYQAHVSAMLKLAGFDNTDARAEKIVALEHAIAEKHWTLEANDDIHKANNPWKQADFAKNAPGLDWTEYFRGAELTKQPSFIVWQPSAFTGESALVASTPLDTWKDWMSYHLIEEYGGALASNVADERFDFFGKTLSGAPQQRPRWQRGIGLVNRLLGDDVGKIYAQKYFSPQAKAEAQEMVTNIIAAFNKRIEALSWMDPKTKAEAQAKLKTLYVGIGYPETWIDYSGYEVKPDDLFGNAWRGGLFEYHRQVNRLGSQVNRKEWSMDPQTVNAVNLPLQNALNFPAAILQPPFFDPQAPAAHNYGAIGSVIGHEISHTFDTEGASFDSQGRLRNWWTPADLAHFNDATAKLAAQYDAYAPFPDLHLNGKQVLAENVADVAGIAASYDGYKASLNGKTAPEQDGFNGDQQFFISFGQNYAAKSRDAALRQQVATDSHSPAEYRSDTVRNIDAWYNSFAVKPGETLYLAPDQRVQIW